MYRQLLITLLVAVIVVMIARMRRRQRGSDGSEAVQPANRADSRVARPLPVWALIGYSLAAMTILATVAVTWMGYHEGNEIIRVEVIDSRSGERTTYQVRRRDLGDREFRTIEGRFVSLGAADRMERVEP